MLRRKVTDLAVCALASRPISNLMQSTRRQCVPVFMLHRMADARLGVRGHQVEQLRAALEFIKYNDYTAITVKDLVLSLINDSPLPERAVAFTLDDGFYDQVDFAFPLFEEYRIPVTLFLATDMMDRGHWSWDYQLEYVIQNTIHNALNFTLADLSITEDISNPAEKRRLIRKLRTHFKLKLAAEANQGVIALADNLEVNLPVIAPPAYQSTDWHRIKQLESEIIQFGPHTCSHHVLTQLNDQEAESEIVNSWKRVQQHVSDPCPVFCYPTGRPELDFGEREKTLVQRAGMKAALSAEPGYIDTDSSKNDLFSLKRFSFPENISHFKQYCSWIERMKEILLRRS